jgi:diguanylate cyclase (GGDEF)-like protein
VSATVRVLCTGLAPASLPDATSALGPFAVELLASLPDFTAQDAASVADAWLIGADTVGALTDWPALLPAALGLPVVLVLPEVTAEAAHTLLQHGVQDVVPTAQATPARLALALRLAVERKRLEVATRKALATDLSTGLPNHAQLLEHMTHLLALREREPAPMALLVLRVHGLAQAEAALGAEAAQVLRRKAAVRLRAGLRASDVVASIGPDAFAVLLAWMDAPADADRVMAKLAQALAQPFSVMGRAQRLQVSAGLARSPEHGRQADALLQRALGQAATLATVGAATPARAADRGPQAAANDDD